MILVILLFIGALLAIAIKWCQILTNHLFENYKFDDEKKNAGNTGADATNSHSDGNNRNADLI